MRVEPLNSASFPCSGLPIWTISAARQGYSPRGAPERSGHSPHSDRLIASVYIRDDVPLLHSGADFDRIAAVSELRVVPQLV